MVDFKNALLTIICVIAFLIGNSQVDNESIISKRLLSVEDGMSARDVRCAVQDRDGFMWFGTSNGLNRYDGKTFKLYNTANTGLSNNSIIQLAIDDQNNLIIIYGNVEGAKARIDSRIQVLDLKTNELKSFEKIYHHLPFDVNKIYWIANDETKSLNFLTYDNFTWWKYNSDKGFEKQYEFKEKNQNLAFESNMYTVYGEKSVFRSNKAAIVLNNSGYLVSRETAILISKSNEFKEERLIKQVPDYSYYNRFLEENSNDHQASVDKRTKLLEQDKIGLADFIDIISVNDQSSLFYNEQKGIYLQSKQNLQQLFTALELKDFFEFSILKNYIDRLGNRWICTSVGVLEVAVKKNHFTHYFEHSTRKLSSTGNQTRGLYAEEGVDGDTTLYANVYLDMLVHQHQKNVLKKGIGGINYAMLHQKEGIYIGSYRLMKYLTQNGIFLPIDTVGYAEVWSLFRFSEQILLAGCAYGINKYDLNTGKRKELYYTSDKIPKAKNIYKILNSATKGLIAVAENGIYCINNQLQIVDYFGKEATDKIHQLPIESIFDLVEDKNGNLWIASGGEGLYKWKWNSIVDANTTIKQFTLIDGLPSLILYRIEQDEQDNLWIGTYNGLLRFDTHRNSSIVYTTKDGLTANEFNRISSFKSKSGALYFGSMNGVNVFSPKTLNREIDSLIVPFRLISLSKFSASINMLKDCLKEYNLIKKMILEVGDKFLSIDFSLLDFQQRIHHYAYKIEGFDKEWNFLEDGSLRISGLPSGEYTVMVKAQLGNGQWSKNEIHIPLTVLKAFYLQWWFLTVSGLFTILLFFLLSYYRNRKLKADKLALENAVENRTQALQKAMGEKDLLLAEIHHRVKNNLQVISGLLQLQSITLDDERLKRAFDEGQSRVNSIALIHENLYQNEIIGKICFHEFIRDLIGKVAELFALGDQHIQFEIGDERILLDLDTAAPLGLIVNELVTNAYKYLPRNEPKNLVLITLKALQKGEYNLLYHDNGPGISGGIDFVTANTLGLKMIKRLSNQLQGNATYQYNHGAEILIVFKEKVTNQEEYLLQRKQSKNKRQ